LFILYMFKLKYATKISIAKTEIGMEMYTVKNDCDFNGKRL